MWRVFAVSVALLSGVSAAELPAQPVSNGATVRVRLRCTTESRCERFVAHADSASVDSVTLRLGPRSSFRVAWRDVAELAVSEGARRRPLKRARAGAVVGLIVSGPLIYACLKEGGEGASLCAIVPLVTAGYGFVIGAVVGLLVKSHDWEPVELSAT